MKTTREWKQVTITKKGTKKLQSGHPWVYEGEVLALEANIQNGDIVDVFSEKGSYQGSGLYNGNSRIRIRLLSRNANDRFDEDFFTAVCSMQSATVQQLWERILMPVA